MDYLWHSPLPHLMWVLTDYVTAVGLGLTWRSITFPFRSFTRIRSVNLCGKRLRAGCTTTDGTTPGWGQHTKSMYKINVVQKEQARRQGGMRRHGVFQRSGITVARLYNVNENTREIWSPKQYTWTSNTPDEAEARARMESVTWPMCDRLLEEANPQRQYEKNNNKAWMHSSHSLCRMTEQQEQARSKELWERTKIEASALESS